MPSDRMDRIRSRHFPRSQGVSPQASSGRSPWGASGGGQLGKGWVGDVYSPGTVVWGTGRSTTGKIGSPVSRCRMKRFPIFVA